VETFGAMAKTEKIAFILEQVRVIFFVCFSDDKSSRLMNFYVANKLLIWASPMLNCVGSIVPRPSGLCSCTNTLKKDKSKSIRHRRI
jgi:hypothetical protein